MIILSKEVSELVGATNPVKIGKLLKDLQLTEEMKDKIINSENTESWRKYNSRTI